MARVRYRHSESDRPRVPWRSPRSKTDTLAGLADIEPPPQRDSAKNLPPARDVLSFYTDLCEAFRRVAAMLAPGGRACVVVGNRTVKGVRLETDVILSELFEHECGLRHRETILRGIPNKLMPLRNSPSNVSGELGETVANEYILILDPA